ncbi:MAG: hypothetical protein KKH70_06910, partial [Gammaproteobacteria bacterium]|nr:hypothetical protein [Gammaproteobacteria bacterium]
FSGAGCQASRYASSNWSWQLNPYHQIRLSLSFVFIRQPRRRKLPGFFLVVLATDLCAVLVQSPNHFAKNACNLTAEFNEEKSSGEKNNIIVSAETLKCFSVAQ